MDHADRRTVRAKAHAGGLGDPTSAAADFRVERQDVQNWRVSPLSTRASHWFDANFARASRDIRVFETDLDGANAFICKARLDGFRTEYIGPLARSYF